MELYQLKPRFKRKTKKRVGRGGKRGTYSGRGQKGQKARAGHRIRPAERDLFSRLPKLRGVKHRSLQRKPFVINVGDLPRLTKENSLDKKILLERNLIKTISDGVKILGTGEIKTAFTITGLKVSAAAKEKILRAGGKIL